MRETTEMLARVLQGIHPRTGRVVVEENTPLPYAVYRVTGNEDDFNRLRYTVEIECFGADETVEEFDDMLEAFHALNRSGQRAGETEATFYLINFYDIPDPNEGLLRALLTFDVWVYRTAINDEGE
jgi:hypothetical protein